MKDTYEPLTTEQLTALRQFAKTHGRYWKAELRGHWERASLSGTIHALRNSHGPSWLNSYRLSMDTAP